MTTIVDADVLIGILRGVEEAREAVNGARRRGERMMSIAPVRVEVLRGVRRGEEAVTHGLLSRLEWIAVDVDLADRAGDLGRTYRESHAGIETVDLLLAAAAERFGAVLLTRNVRHFPMFPELRPAF